jgi:hypothetical protein
MVKLPRATAMVNSQNRLLNIRRRTGPKDNNNIHLTKSIGCRKQMDPGVVLFIVLNRFITSHPLTSPMPKSA